MVWITDIPLRSLSKPLGDCGGREHWAGDVNYEMYKEQRAEDVLLHRQSILFKLTKPPPRSRSTKTQVLTKPCGSLLMKNSSITNRKVGSCFGYNDWNSPDAISYSRLQGIPMIFPDRLHECWTSIYF